MPRLDRYLVGFVLAHFAVVMVHSAAHLALGILPAIPDAVFILVAIIGGPLVALALLRVNRMFAAGLQAVLLTAAFAYGFDSHFVVPGPDRVAIAGPPWTAVFVVSAALIAVLELASIVIAVAVFRAAARTPSAPAGPPA